MTCDSQAWSLPGAGTASSWSWAWREPSKNHRWETGAEIPCPVSACARVGLRSRGFGVSLGKHGPACPEEMPDAARSSSPPGAVAGGEPGDVAQPLQSKVQSHVRLTKINERKGKTILLLTPRAVGLCRRGCVGSHDCRQRSRSSPRQAQWGAPGSDSHPQVGAAVSPGSPPPTATVPWPAGPSASPAGTVTAPAPSPPRHRGSSLNTERAFGSPGALLYGAAASFPSMFSAFFP